MFLGYLTLITALAISAVAIYYSVAGLAAIFASAVIPIVIMGVALEAGKLVTAVWLHRYWKQAAWWLKTYLSVAVFVLMFITSMGIFGFLSKAHIDQTASVGNNSLQVELIDQRITREQKRIADSDLVISQLDKTVQVLLDADRIRGENGAIATREAQKQERASLNAIITEAQNNVAKLQEEKLVLEKQQVAIEAEVGPIKYIAEFIYGTEADKNLLEEAVRWVIIILIFVFDPLAILLLIASQYTFEYHRKLRDDNNGDRLRPEESSTGEKVDGLVAASTSRTENNGRDTTDGMALAEKGDIDDTVMERTNVDADATVRDMVPEDNVSDTAKTNERVEHIEIQPNGPNPEEIAAAYQSVEKKDIKSLEELKREADYELKEQDEIFQTNKNIWKEAHPDQTLKHYKNLYIKGLINSLPWEANEQDDNYNISGYQQNAEQNENTLFNKINKRRS